MRGLFSKPGANLKLQVVSSSYINHFWTVIVKHPVLYKVKSLLRDEENFEPRETPELELEVILCETFETAT